MRTTRSLLLVLVMAPATAGAWENFKTHPEITDAAIAHSRDLDAILRDHYGLPDGLATGLAPQVGFAEEAGIENPEFLRFQRDKSLANLPPLEWAPEDVRPEFAVRCDLPLDSPGFAVCFPRVVRARNEVGKLLRAGSFGEDNPNIRASHHFHDPIKEHDNPLVLFDPFPQPIPIGNRGLDNTSDSFFGQALREPFFIAVTKNLRGGGDFRLHGVSARERALGRAQETSFEPANLYSLADAERYLYAALTAGRFDEREHWMALHFLAVGSVLHLLEDMGSVAHTRNDFLSDHLVSLIPFQGPSLEDAGQEPEVIRFLRERLAPRDSDLAHSRPVGILRSFDAGRFPGHYRETLPLVDPITPDHPPFDARDFWDRYDTPEAENRQGLAEVANRYFYSRTTIDDRVANGIRPDTSYPNPSVPSCRPAESGRYEPVGAVFDEKGSGTDRVFTTTLPERFLLTGGFVSESPDDEVPFFSSELVPHLARCRFHAKARRGHVMMEAHTEATVIDESVQRDYLEIMLPLTIDYTAKFLENYFRPRIDAVPVGTADFKLANLTRLPFEADATSVEIVYEGENRLDYTIPVSCSGDISLDPAPEDGKRGPLSAATCSMPVAESLPVPPALGDTFTIVVRGRHGERGTSDAFGGDWVDEDFVTAFVRVEPTLVYDSSRGSGTPPNTDEPEKVDVFQQPIDPRRAGAPDDVDAAREVNLTAAFRAALGREDIDFGRAVQEGSRGRRIALRSDVFTSPLPGSNPREIQANAEVLIFDPFSDSTPAALDRIPGSELSLAQTLRRDWELAWSHDGDGLYFRRGLAFDAIDLVRWTLGSGTLEVFSNPIAQVSTFARENVQSRDVGTELETCSGAQQIEALSAARLLVVADCMREVVVLDSSGQKALQLMNRGDSLLFMDVTSVSGQLQGTYTHRYVVDQSSATASIVPCSGASCSVHASVSAFSPRLDPTGQRVAFLFRPDDSTLLETARQLYVADTAGTIRRLVRLEEAGTRSIADPTWSPDGNWLAFLIIDTGPDGTRDLYVVRTDQPGLQEPLRVTHDADVSGSVYWRSTGLVLPVQ